MEATLALGTFGPEHLPAACALSRAEGWPHREADWALILGLSEGLAITSGGRLLGCGMLTRYGGAGRLSMILVAPEARGRGLGRRLLAALLDLAGDLPLSLCATEAGAPLYAKAGFRASGVVEQWQGEVPAAAAAPDPAPGDPAAALALDRRATGCDRQALLAALGREGRLLGAPGGYALLRAFGHGHMLGPVVAPDAAAALDLVRRGAALAAGGFLRTDLMAGHVPAAALTALGLSLRDRGTVMARGDLPPAEGVFGLASQGFG
ncbi:GNAT family N-acetyltransferase [Poseidonocella sp. HB161398]|uniref:GNAT family N-acetyltransferase n=1 Tax=Poseidonocella sp. HB161398 TaxID=2320855 RepID=UPI001109EBD3|nr:GNAT family N-acetyltransferase [Poseidonocella sp. HB161398]